MFKAGKGRSSVSFEGMLVGPLQLAWWPRYTCSPSSTPSKVEAQVVDHLRDLGADAEDFEVVEIFPM